jgi:hypothetical protein
MDVAYSIRFSKKWQATKTPSIKIRGQNVHLSICFEYVSATTRRMGRLPTQWWGWISNTNGCKSWIAKRMFGRINIYDKSGV